MKKGLSYGKYKLTIKGGIYLKQIEVYRYDAFSKKPGMGNSAGIVLNGDELTEEEMQEIAYKVGFNETVFLLTSICADYQCRFFTPGQEVPLCGHGTIAMLSALKTNGLLMDKSVIMVETKAGILRLEVSTDNGEAFISMEQAPAKFETFSGSKLEVADSMGISEEEIDERFPIVYGSTGSWTLLVPIKELKSFERMVPKNERFPSLLEKYPRASLHPFCLETYHEEALMHGRHFSSFYSGIEEDSVTGTASGAMGAYFTKYIDDRSEIKMTIEQGQEIGKDGLLQVEVLNKRDVKITGTAVYVETFLIEING